MRPHDWNFLISVNIFRPMEEDKKQNVGVRWEKRYIFTCHNALFITRDIIYRHLAERDLKGHSLWTESHVTCSKQMGIDL